MRLFQLLLLLLILSHSTSFFAQNYTQTLKGKVIDLDTKIPLYGVKIVLLNTEPKNGTVSDADGNFRFEKLPIGRYDIRFTLAGYDDVTLNQIQLSTGKELMLNIEMSERIKEMETMALSYPGVEKAYAIQAGRELRIIMGAEKTSDDQADVLAFELSNRIMTEMRYPGQVKITVIREKRSVGVAK